MDIQNQVETAKVIYAKDLVKSIFPEDTWMTQSRDDSTYVKGKKVERSNVTGKPHVRRNKQSNKIDAKRRTLAADDYSIHEFASDPEVIIFTEESLANPQMRATALDEHQKSINEQIGHFLKSEWAASAPGSIFRTSGDNKPATGKAATGTRKIVTYDDWLEAYQAFLLWGIMPDNALVPATMYKDLLKIEEFIQSDFVNDKVVPTGKIGKILGMEVWATPLGTHYSNAVLPVVQQLVPEDDGSEEGVSFAGGTDSNLAINIWNKDYVTRAKGNAKVFIDPDNAEAQGTLMSANCLAGGGKYRKDATGVVSIVESPGA